MLGAGKTVGAREGFEKAADRPPAELFDMLTDQQTVFAVKGSKDIHIFNNYSGKPRSANTLKALVKKLADHI